MHRCSGIKGMSKLSETDANAAGAAPSWRSYLADAAVVMVAAVAVKQAILPITIQFAGPVSLLVAMALASWRLWSRGESWRALGLRRPQRLWLTLAGGVGVAAVIIASVAVSAPLATEILHIDKVADAGAGRFGDMEGNLPLFMMWLAISWIHAGFNEEMIYRAFLISRFEGAFALLGKNLAGVIAIFLAAAFFGYRHMYYQGWYGFVTTGVIALSLGALYLFIRKRNIWPLIVGHGLIDTLGMTARYLGADG